MSFYTADHRRRAMLDAVAEARTLGEARMLRDDQDLTPQLTDAIVTRFRDLLAKIGKSESWAARSMDIKPTTLSQVLSGTYKGDFESRLRKIDKWTELQAHRASAKRDRRFAKTSVALEIIGAAKIAKRRGRLVIVHGPAGIGKTMCAEYLRAEMPGTIYIRITTAGSGVSAIYTMLAEQLLPAGGGKLTNYQRELQVQEILRGNERLIIVDEAHKLAIKRKDHGLHVLRDLYDATGCPQLWLGTADVAKYIEDGREAVEAVEQIYSRVSYWLDLTHAASRQDNGPGLHSVDDVRKMLASHSIRVTPDAEQYLYELINEPRMGGPRVMIELCEMILDKMPDSVISREMLVDTQEERLGKRGAAILEQRLNARMRRVG